MNAARLIIAAIVKLATLAAFVWLTLRGAAGWASPLLVLFLVTRLPAAGGEAAATPRVVPPPAAADPSKKLAA